MKKMNYIVIIFLLILVSIANFGSSGIIEKISKDNISECSNINNSWIQVIGENGDLPGGFGISSNAGTRAMGIFQDELYIGTQNHAFSAIPTLLLRFSAINLIFMYRLTHFTPFPNIVWRLVNIVIPLAAIFSDGCELWKYNHSANIWSPIISNADGAILPAGIGTQKSWVLSVVKEFKDNLYIGTTKSSLYGGEIWRFDGNQITKVVEDGFDDRFNSGIWSCCIFDEELYVGTMNWKKGCKIYKTSDGTNWEKLNIPGGDGFGTRWNIYLWSMAVFDGSLLFGTANPNGGQIWKYDGNNWDKFELPGGDGFGDSENYGIRNMIKYNGDLWVSTATNGIMDSEACEIWKFDGSDWTQIIGEEGVISDGFGDSYNKYAWTMQLDSANHIWVGTMSIQAIIDGAPAVSKGCEIWRYDGINWEEIVGDDDNSEIENGFGDPFNIGARSMIEYPKESGIMWIGTFNTDLFEMKTFTGCEIWRRIP